MIHAIEPLIFSAPDVPHQYEAELTRELPDYVRGTLYLNGPARFQIGATTRQHWLDGDGLARALTLDGAKARYRAHYVHTLKFTDESEAGQALYRTFGWAAPGDRLSHKMLLATPANVSLYPFAGKLLAFGEQALPYALDPARFETEGEFDFGGQFTGSQPVSAHAKLDRDSGSLCNFGIAYLGGLAKLHYHEISPELELKVRGACVLKGANYIHDFAISKRYAVFHLAPYRVDIRTFIGSPTALQDAIRWEPQGSCSLRILDRSSGKELADVALPRLSFCLHTINAFEADGHLILDVVDTPLPFFDQYIAKPHMFSELLPCATVRFVIDTASWTLLETRVAPYQGHYDFPNGGRLRAQQDYRYFWAAGMPAAPAPTPKFYNRLFRFDWQDMTYAETYEAPAHQVLGGEPLVVENPNRPEEVTVIAQGYDLTRATSCYHFFDGMRLSDGPYARLDLPFFDPLGFHTSWQPMS